MAAVQQLKTKVLIIGAGTGGYVAGIRCGQLGLDTVLVDGGDGLGGVEGADLDHAVPSLPVTGPGGGPEARVARLRAHERA